MVLPEKPLIQQTRRRVPNEYGGSVASLTIRSVVTSLIGKREDWNLHRPRQMNRPHFGMSSLGPIAMITATAAGWFAFKDAVGEEDPVAFALFIGSVSIVLMVWSNLLSTRLRFLEPLFGGLDRTYAWHRWFGALSVAAMWYHIQTIDDVEGIRGASESVADTAEELAGLGETVLYVLVVVSVIRWVPYRWWKISHKLMIVPFVFSSWHFHTSTKPYANDDLWGRWFQALMLMGIAAWCYRVLWYDIFRQGHRYSVSRIENLHGTTTLELIPINKKLTYRPGQFAFFRLIDSGSKEAHPFTIASHPHEPCLRIHIKGLGDWSCEIATKSAVGDVVRVEGPYGRLQLFPSRSDRKVVWVAGGVGITPFLGVLKQPSWGVLPHLFYAVRSREEAPELDELELAHRDGRLVLHLFVSREGQRLTTDDIITCFANTGLERAHVVMCGPSSLVRQMTAVVRSLGANRVHVEEFDMRSGVGPTLSRPPISKAFQ